MLSLTRDINPDMDPARKDAVVSNARKVFAAFGARGAPRLDFLCNDKTGEIWFNEINPIPGSYGYFLWERGGKAAALSGTGGTSGRGGDRREPQTVRRSGSAGRLSAAALGRDEGDVMKKPIAVLLAALVLLSSVGLVSTPSLAEDPATLGQKVFKKKCFACHKVGDKAKPGVGRCSTICSGAPPARPKGSGNIQMP